MDRKMIGLAAAVVAICALAGVAAVFLYAPAQPVRTPTGQLDFTVSGASDCLRFLNASVPTVYVPFTIAANENWQLTVNATKMPGGANAWTDVYM